MRPVVENVSLTEYVIYPNPTSNLLTISINGIKNIVITDSGGKTCNTIRTLENRISVADLKPGSYIINVFHLTINYCLQRKSLNYDQNTLNNEPLQVTNWQPGIAGGFRRRAFTKPINDKGKANIKQVNPALRLPVARWRLL